MYESLVQKAIKFAAEKHKGQIRKKSGLPYIVHPFSVMQLIVKYKGNSSNIENLQCAALLHDTVEDTKCTFSELEREFNPMIAAIVIELTSDEVVISKIGKKDYLKNKMLEMSNYAFILKLLDRFDNIMDSPSEKYALDTKEMMYYLLNNKSNLSERQNLIINEILNNC